MIRWKSPIMLPCMLHIMPPAPTTMASPIIVALAVMAERVGCRVMLPCASSPMPSRAKRSATSRAEHAGHRLDERRADQHQAEQEEQAAQRHSREVAR